jgi:glycogen synthase
VEAQLSATPVVAAASGGLLDVVADGRTGRTFPPGQPAALARAVEAVVADPATAARLAEAARRSAAARFTPQAAARTYAEVYAAALQARRPRRQQTTPSRPRPSTATPRHPGHPRHEQGRPGPPTARL